eukprot:3170325-Alexandrium_andersonii.AAC.1
MTGTAGLARSAGAARERSCRRRHSLQWGSALPSCSEALPRRQRLQGQARNLGTRVRERPVGWERWRAL